MGVIVLRCLKCGATFSITDERGQPVELTEHDVEALLRDSGCPVPYCWGELARDDA